MNGWGQSARLAVPAFLWIALMFAAFHDKAFTIDDPFFLAQARQVLAHPLDPSGFDIVWGTQVGRASNVSPTGPGMAYLLAPTVALGGAEWVAHATVFAFLALGAWAVAAMALRLGAEPRDARLAACMLATTPVVLAMAGTAMPDVPAMAVALVAMERTLALRRAPGLALGAAVAVLFAAAILIRSHAVMLLGVAAILCVGADLRSRGLGAALDLRRLWPLLVALPLALLFAWLTRDADSGVMNFATSADFLKLRAVPRRLTGFFFHFLLALPFALAWAALHPRRLSWRLYLVCLLILAFSLSLKRIWGAPFAAFAAVALWDALRTAWRAGDVDRVALVLWLFAALPVAIYVHLPAKYLAISAPAGVLLLILEARSISPRARRALAVGWLVGGALLGVAILRADARLAAVGREAAARLVAPRVAAGSRVYYSGSWGFHWYAETAGAKALAANRDALRPGDFIVYSSFRYGALGEEHFGRLVDLLTEAGPGGRVMDREALAGFYSDMYGFLPWSWSSGVVDQFELWRVHPAPVADSEAEPLRSPPPSETP